VFGVPAYPGLHDHVLFLLALIFPHSVCSCSDESDFDCVWRRRAGCADVQEQRRQSGVQRQVRYECVRWPPHITSLALGWRTGGQVDRKYPKDLTVDTKCKQENHWSKVSRATHHISPPHRLTEIVGVLALCRSTKWTCPNLF
jgi:hypothetical protein